MPSHTGHKQLRRVAWNQVGNEKVDGNCSPERNKIKTNSTEQITHAYPLPKVRPQRIVPTTHARSGSPAVYCRGGASSHPCYSGGISSHPCYSGGTSSRPVSLAGLPPALLLY